MPEFSPSALKDVLLKAKSTSAETEILDTRVYLCRLATAELINHEDALTEAQTSGNIRIASELSIQTVIGSLVHPDGSLTKAKDKPTAKELPTARDNVVLLDAIDKVKEHAISKLETTEKS